MLGELEQRSGRWVVADLEQGVGTISRLASGQVDRLVLVVEPYAKAIETARRAQRIADELGIPTVVVANRSTMPADLDRIRAVLGDVEVLTVPDDPVVRRADRRGVAPIDLDPAAPAVQAIEAIADRLCAELAPAE